MTNTKCVCLCGKCTTKLPDIVGKWREYRNSRVCVCPPAKEGFMFMHKDSCPQQYKISEFDSFMDWLVEQEKVNYMQVGQAIKCGACDPQYEHCEELTKKHPDFKCECRCHKEK